MWNLRFEAPRIIVAEVLTTMPEALQMHRRTDWATANRGGKPVASFIEGPAFDRQGNLYLSDIPNGRIFRIDQALRWELVAEYDGWPNGLAIHRDGGIWITDYRKGLLRLDPGTGRIEPLLTHRNSESFRGVNDLVFDAQGRCWFTDQGQTGLQDPTGKVYRWDPVSDRLDCLMSTVPSPNGIALDVEQQVLFVAVTRANAVWRGPLMRDGTVSKVAAFRTFFGSGGPDGLAVDADNRLIVAHVSLGGAFIVEPTGEINHFVRSSAGRAITNIAFEPGTRRMMMTDSETGSVLVAQMPSGGPTLFSHA
ncbi:MAG: SMP-30/gluconolactonase/LRE family protein [Quisquiliibacterium sp.]